MTNHSRLALFVILIVSPFWACSHLFSPPPETSEPARALIAETRLRNQGLKTFKGVGSVRVQKQQTRHTARLMWAGDLQNRKIRMEVLEISGRPLMSLSNDGKTSYIYVHDSQKYYKTQKKQMDLKRFLSVQVTLDDLLVILAGGIPIRQHQYAQKERCEETPGACLVLKDRWGKTLEKIFWSPDGQEIEKIEMFIPSGELAYRTEFVGVKHIGDYRLPKQMIIYGPDGDGASLRIDRYQTDVDLPAEMFRVSPPENS